MDKEKEKEKEEKEEEEEEEKKTKEANKSKEEEGTENAYIHGNEDGMEPDKDASSSQPPGNAGAVDGSLIHEERNDSMTLPIGEDKLGMEYLAFLEHQNLELEKKLQDQQAALAQQSAQHSEQLRVSFIDLRLS